jgi:uncharacterized protein with PIN domain
MLQRLWGKIRGVKRPTRMRAMPPEQLAQMVRMVATTRPDEIGCEECYEQLDRFAELALAGRNAAEAMPLVQDHLARCGDCREEFEALLAALQAEAEMR